MWRIRGHVLRGVRRARAATDAYARAERWYARAGETLERGRCLIGMVDALMYAGRYREALRAAARGRRLLAQAGDRLARARLANNEGNIHHRLDRPKRALECYREARSVLARASDARGVAMVDGNVANCLSMMGLLGAARRRYRHARRALARAGFPLDALSSEYNLAYLEFLEHHDERALRELERVRAAARASGCPSLVALATLDRAEILLRLGAHEQAEAEALRAIEHCAALDLGYERAKAETFAALAEHRLGRDASARSRLERSLAAFHAEGNVVWKGEVLVGLATVWTRDGNPRAAAALLAAARRQFARAGDREREGAALALLARTRVACGDPGAAEACLRALRGRSAGSASPRLGHLALAAEAAVALARGRPGRARARLARAAATAERLAARILDAQWRATFWGEWGWPHLELATLELRAGRVAQALEALERGRGLALGARTTSRDRGALPTRARPWAASHLARERERVARSGPGPATWGAGRIEPERAPPARDAIRRLLASTPRAIRARELSRALEPDALLVDYMVHDGGLDAIAVRRDGLTACRRLAGTRPLARLVHALLFELRGAAFTPVGARTVDPALADTLGELAALVLWPVLGSASGESLPRSLAVVPAGPLTRLPWAALPLPDGRRLCEALELVVVPGLRLAMRAARERARAGRWVGEPPLVVAADAGELASVEAEAAAVTAAFPEARLLAGAEATAGRFLDLAPRAAWIHFAGHGHYRADRPEASALRFADRWLAASELSDLSLAASWVTLSACQGARALVQPGEEWFGLPRALLMSGAGCAVASQWDTEDEAAAALMADVYRRLASRQTLAAALAQAQSARARAGAHPLEWAGFVLLGAPMGRAPIEPAEPVAPRLPLA
ncbi:MAG TPA: CHAT domain-containing protein [Candidatus Eisenbacteria bacterium]